MSEKTNKHPYEVRLCIRTEENGVEDFGEVLYKTTTFEKAQKLVRDLSAAELEKNKPMEVDE